MAINKTKWNTYRVVVYDLQGKRETKSFKKKADAKEYESKLKIRQLELKRQESGLSSAKIPFEKALNEFSATKQNLRKKTIQKYQGIIGEFNNFIESLDLYYVSDFTPDHATIFYSELIKKRFIPESNREVIPKPKTVNGYLALVRAFFNIEVVKGHIVTNPMNHIRNVRVEKNKPDFYTEEELKEFFNQQMHSNYKLAFIGLLHTGMRIEELANIHWSDIDFSKRTVKVSRKENFNPKTSNSERTIPLNEVIYNELLNESKNKKSEIFVFTSVNGRKIRERTLLNVCKKIASKAGIQSRAYLHKFRHTFATHLVRKNVAIERVQKLLGHSSISETLIYAHLKPDDMHDEVNLLNTLI